MSTAPFDFEAFIAGTSLARCTVTAYRVDHRDEIARLTAEHDALPDTGGDQRLSSKSPRHDLAAKIAALRSEMEASRVEWTLRTLTPEEFRDLPEITDRPGDTDEQKAENATRRFDVVLDLLATMSRPPEGATNPGMYRDLPQLTAEQWRKISVVLGVAQWGQLVQQANNHILSLVAVPDFSPTVSQTLSPRASSES